MIQYVVFAMLLVALAYFLSREEKKSKKNQISIIGATGSRKTQLFYKLCFGKEVSTNTSFSVNKGSVKVKDDDVLVVDIPGHSSFLGEEMTSIG